VALGGSGTTIGPTTKNRNFARHCISSFGCSFQTPCGVGTSTSKTTTGGDICPKS